MKSWLLVTATHVGLITLLLSLILVSIVIFSNKSVTSQIVGMIYFRLPNKNRNHLINKWFSIFSKWYLFHTKYIFPTDWIWCIFVHVSQKKNPFATFACFLLLLLQLKRVFKYGHCTQVFNVINTNIYNESYMNKSFVHWTKILSLNHSRLLSFSPTYI